MDVLCQSHKEFYCYICGHHPWTSSTNEINGNNENDAAIDLDEVNTDKFWERVELNIMSNIFSRVTLKSLNLKPNLYFWAPYIGKKRDGELMF